MDEQTGVETGRTALRTRALPADCRAWRTIYPGNHQGNPRTLGKIHSRDRQDSRPKRRSDLRHLLQSGWQGRLRIHRRRRNQTSSTTCRRNTAGSRFNPSTMRCSSTKARWIPCPRPFSTSGKPGCRSPVMRRRMRRNSNATAKTSTRSSTPACWKSGCRSTVTQRRMCPPVVLLRRRIRSIAGAKPNVLMSNNIRADRTLLMWFY